MFTGLIKAVCRVTSVRRNGDAMRLTVDLGPLASQTQIGDSIAVNGVCLTVVELNRTFADFDISPETLTKTTLAALTLASHLNVEPAVKANDRLGGHFVQGHVDGTAKIKMIHTHNHFADIEFAAGPELLDQMVVKGSVAVDGISLTIATMNQDSFSVAIIPETLEKTTLGKAKLGDAVNVEIDIIAKIVKRQLQNMLPKHEKLTVEKLKELGF